MSRFIHKSDTFWVFWQPFQNNFIVYWPADVVWSPFNFIFMKSIPIMIEGLICLFFFLAIMTISINKIGAERWLIVNLNTWYNFNVNFIPLANWEIWASPISKEWRDSAIMITRLHICDESSILECFIGVSSTRVEIYC